MQHISQSIKPRSFGRDRLPQGELLQYAAKYSCISGLETLNNAVFLLANETDISFDISFDKTFNSLSFKELQLKQIIYS